MLLFIFFFIKKVFLCDKIVAYLFIFKQKIGTK